MLLQKLIEFFYTWEARIGVILSMKIQIILVFFGSRRKISDAIWLQIPIWLAYMSADAVAVFSLGVLAQGGGESYKEEPLQNLQLHLLWVPFLILHLGGPDTITAYSLEDNKLWLRHMLNLFIQTGVALHAIIKSWDNDNPLTYLVIPIFVSGVAKYCERIRALASASMERIGRRSWDLQMKVEGNYFDEVYRFQCILTQYLADEYIEVKKEVLDQGIIILDKTFLDAFRLVKDELGLVYDKLYTKAIIIYSRWGICLRIVYLVSSMATLTSFVIIHVHKHKWFNYPLSDVLITYFLMIGAVILEIYATIWIVLSDWMLAFLDRGQTSLAKFLFPKIKTCSRVLFGERRWSSRMKQWNILTYAVSPKKKGILVTLASHLWRYKLINANMFFAYVGERIEEVFDRQTKHGSEQEALDKETSGFERCISGESDYIRGIKEVIFQVIVDRLDNYRSRVGNDSVHASFGFLPFRAAGISLSIPVRAAGISILSDYLYRSVDEVITSCLDGLSWRISRTGFDEALFVWHIATTLCYYSDQSKGVFVPDVNAKAGRSKIVSDYLMYVAWSGQKLLPAGNYEYQLYGSTGELRQILGIAASPGLSPKEQKTGPGNNKFSREHKINFDDFGVICEQLLQVARKPAFGEAKHENASASKGMKLAVELHNLDVEKKWEMMSEVWAHLLLYAAGAHTRWEAHAQHLRRGGEFITHVAALMAHASLSLLEKANRDPDREEGNPEKGSLTRESEAGSCA